MKRRWIGAAITALLVGIALSAAGTATAAAAKSGDVRAAFFANWDRYARGYFVNRSRPASST